MTLILSPTAFLTFEDCPRQYHYRYVLKTQPLVKSANLVFGDVIHQVLDAYLRRGLNRQSVDLAALFRTLWQERTQAEAIDYPAHWSPETLLATSQCLVAQFPLVWEEAGLMPLLDAQGEPLLERRLEAPIAPGLILRGKLDGVVMDRQARLILLDFKTPGQAGDPVFAQQAEQLTAYQWLLEQHAENLGIPGIDGLGFLELIKRKVPVNGRGKGPEVCAPVIVPQRNDAELDRFREKLSWLAENIQRGRFPRQPRMAHNSPCTLCDFRQHGVHGNPDGLRFPKPTATVTL